MQFLVSNLEGDSLFTSHVGQEPSHMKIGEVKKQGNNIETVVRISVFFFK